MVESVLSFAGEMGMVSRGTGEVGLPEVCETSRVVILARESGGSKEVKRSEVNCSGGMARGCGRDGLLKIE